MTTHRLEADVLEQLRAATVSGNTLTLAGQVDRKLYLRVAKALETLGGVWKRQQRCHVFEDAAEEVVATAIATGTVFDARKHFQFFETPPDVAKRIVDLAEVEPDHVVLEPSAGKGAIVDELAAQASPRIAVCEVQDALRSDYGADRSVEVLGGDFLGVEPDPRFDRVVMNPPFTRGQDVDHVRHALRFLKPGGRLVSVMSPGWTFRTDRKHAEFREMFEAEQAAGRARREDLPDGSFKLSGTMVRTTVVVFDAPR